MYKTKTQTKQKMKSEKIIVNGYACVCAMCVGAIGVYDTRSRRSFRPQCAHVLNPQFHNERVCIACIKSKREVIKLYEQTKLK